MKIIKRGTPEQEWIYGVACLKCSSVLEYDKSDIHSDRDGSYIICPVCGKFISSSVGKRKVITDEKTD